MKKSQSTANFQADGWWDPAQCRRARKRPAPKGLQADLREAAAAYKACGRQGQAWPEGGGRAEGWVPPLPAPPHSLLESCKGPDSTPSPESLLLPCREASGGWLSPGPRDRTGLLRATHVGWPEAAQVRGFQAPGWTGARRLGWARSPGVVNSGRADVDNPGTHPGTSIRRFSGKVLLYHRTAEMVNGFCPLTAGTFLSPSVRLPTSLRLI